MFIELTNLDGNKFFTNINQIESVAVSEKEGGKTVIVFPIISEVENYVFVKEPYEEVKALIEKEVAAERGY